MSWGKKVKGNKGWIEYRGVSTRVDDSCRQSDDNPETPRCRANSGVESSALSSRCIFVSYIYLFFLFFKIMNSILKEQW